MDILHFDLIAEPSQPLLERMGGRMVSLPELEALAMPAAIRTRPRPGGRTAENEGTRRALRPAGSCFDFAYFRSSAS